MVPSKLKHLTYITDIIRNNPGISKTDLLAQLKAYNQPTNERTLDRDIRLLAEQYEVEISINPQNEGLEITAENNPSLRTFEHFAKTQVLGGMLNDMLTNGTKVWNVVDIDDQVPIMNLEHVKDLVEAILNKERVRITYLKFFQKEPDTYEIEPHLIRQVIKRWYLIAGDASTEPATIKTFGLERIIKVQKLSAHFEPQTAQIKKRIKNVYGISQYNNKRETVLLETNRWQGKFFETLPAHTSQRVEYLMNDICHIQLHIVVNIELMQLLASQPHPIKILKPESLKIEYREFIENKLSSLD